MVRQQDKKARQTVQQEEVLAVASKLFAEKGMENTSLWEIAVQVNVSDVQILRLFGMKKENLLLAIFRRLWDEINKHIQELKANSALEAKQKLMLLYEEFLHQIKDSGPIGYVFMTHARRSGKLGREIVETGVDRFARLIDDIIQQGQRQGFFQERLNIQAVRQQIIGCIENTLLGWIWNNQALYPADYTIQDALHVFEAIVNGISMSGTAYREVSPTDRKLLEIATLTPREREVIILVGEGIKPKQIAERMFISITTVRHHLTSIFEKLNVTDRVELAIFAYRYGLAKLPLTSPSVEKATTV